MGFQHPQQRAHMMKGVQAAMKSAKTPLHLKPHLQNRLAPNVQPGNKPLSTMEPDDDELMGAAARTPDFDADDSQQAVNPMEESLGQEAISGGLKRDVSKRGSVQLDRPRMSPLMARANPKTPRKVRKPRDASAFFGDFGGRPKGI